MLEGDDIILVNVIGINIILKLGVVYSVNVVVSLHDCAGSSNLWKPPWCSGYAMPCTCFMLGCPVRLANGRASRYDYACI